MKIMVCYDGSSDNTAILEKAQERAKASDASVYLLSVLVGDDVGQLDEIEPAQKNLAAAQESFKAEDISCETRVLFGGNAAGKSIVKYAEENEIDEIIIGIQKTSKVGKFLFGSTAQEVILEAHCPVLTVK